MATKNLGGYSYNTKTKVIKTPKVRKREKQYKTAGMVGGGLGAAALTGAAILNRKRIGSAFKKMKTPKGSNFSRYNSNKQGDTNMFIGYMENEGYYEFARRKGSKDRKPRSRRSALGTAAKIAGGAAALGATGLALKNAPKAAKAGMRAAKSARGSLLGQNSNNKLYGLGAGLKTAGASLRRNMGKDVRRGAGAVSRGAENLRAKTVRAGYAAADRVGGAVAGLRSGVAGAKAARADRIANTMRPLPRNKRPK